jgi:hypothetical protein
MKDGPQKFRVSLAKWQFATVEIDAHSPLLAEMTARANPPAFAAPSDAFVFRVEERVPVPGKPGEYQWQEIKGAL